MDKKDFKISLDDALILLSGLHALRSDYLFNAGEIMAINVLIDKINLLYPEIKDI